MNPAEALEAAMKRRGLGQGTPPAPIQSQGPAPTVALSDIATKLIAFQEDLAATTINGATLADGIEWDRVKGELTNQDTGLFALAVQATDWAYQLQAMQTWQTQAQAYIQSLEQQHTQDQSNLSACEARAGTPSQPDTMVAAIAVGAVLIGGIVGFVGGRSRELGGKWPWTW